MSDLNNPVARFVEDDDFGYFDAIPFIGPIMRDGELVYRVPPDHIELLRECLAYLDEHWEYVPLAVKIRKALGEKS